jgi:GAF domain-containing protein
VAVVAVGLGSALNGQHASSWVWLGATGVVAATVALTRTPLERLADRVAYGPGGDPYAQLSQFVQRISDTLAVDDVLPHVAQTVTRALHSPRGEVRLWLPDGAEWRQTWPANLPGGVSNVDVPLQHRGEQVGVVGVDTVSGDLSEEERGLLQRLAGTAGLALANVRLAYDLRRRLAESRDLAARLELSRQRLLDAAAEETERFSLTVDRQVQSRLRWVGSTLDQIEAANSEQAAEVNLDSVDAAIAAATEALSALRELAAGVFPPALADRGLTHALEVYCLRYDGRVGFGSNDADARTAFAVEAAAYFCAVRVIDDCVGAADVDAGPGRVDVDLRFDDRALTIDISAPLPPTPQTLLLLEDRVEATDGSLDQATQLPEGSLTMTWDLTRTASTSLHDAADDDAAAMRGER